ncbi:MAG: hypothetical protein E6J43_12795, partial [Chloroflexi bacterium]
MLRAVALVVGLCAVFGFVLYVAYSGDTIPTPRSGEQPANYRALAQFSPIDVYFVSPQVGWLVLGNNRTGFSDDGRILATRDGGKTWYVQSAPPVRPMQFIDERNGWGYIWWQLSPSTTPKPEESPTFCQCLAITHDGGQSWQQLPPAPKYPQNFTFKFVDENAGWGVYVTIKDQRWEAGLFRT